jgi:glyoxylase-like metal-dependent hydrolase (beta-lactamase superfamily II)
VHVVHKQPATPAELSRARAALAACPVAAIRLETLAERRHNAAATDNKAAVEEAWTPQDEWTVKHMSAKTGGRPFPRPFLLEEGAMTDTSIRDVYWTGHHNEASFGNIPYLLRAIHHDDDKNNQPVWIMVDTPKFSKAAVDGVISVTGLAGPDYLFLTHVDDTFDHGKWSTHFPRLKRIFHSGDLGPYNWIGDTTLEDVEILLPTILGDEKTPPQGDDGVLTAYNLDGTVLSNDWTEQLKRGELDVVIVHTPSHSPGSISLLKRRVSAGDSSCPGILFTGDTYAYTTADGGKMTGFGMYGKNLQQQVETLSRILTLGENWDVIAPGHGHTRDYRSQQGGDDVKAAEMKVAQEDLIPRSASSRT